ncbi:MAG: SPOR domain-containing protein [bacterium]|nr:SPOR domain-containing protein [bacterium]MCP4799595.1 SPOR domain-containing protein [bacterium]
MNKVVFIFVLLFALPACSQCDEVDTTFKTADYPVATALLDSLGIDGQTGVDHLYWRIRLESDPEELIFLFDESEKYFLNFPLFADFVNIEKCRLQLAYSNYSPEDSPDNLSPFLSAQHCYRDGDYDKADKLFSSINNSESDFSWALYYKAMIALRRGEHSKAAQILENIDNIYNYPSLLWAMYHATKLSDPDKSIKTAEFINSEYPMSLSCLAIETNYSLSVIEPVIQPLEENITFQADGRFSIQFAAFFDRSNAITFNDSWQDIIPGLEIVSFNSNSGGMVYRLRLGSWKTRPDAESASDFYQNKYELESIVIDTTDGL